MTTLFERIGEWNFLTQRLDDDFCDRFSYYYTVALLVAASLITGGRQLISERIQCWSPTEFSFTQTHYVNDYCYVASTYYVPSYERLPGPDGPRARMINYYQWVTLFILSQAVLFLLPKLIWRTVFTEGFYVSSIAQRLKDTIAKSVELERRKKLILDLVHYVDRYLERQEQRVCCWPMPYWCRQHQPCCQGVYIYTAYTLIKLIYLANACGQIFLVNNFLGESGYVLWGYEVLKDFFNSGVIELSEIFPIVTICDFTLRIMGENQHRYTVQCVLTINLFHDRVYLVIWFWLCFVCLLSLLGCARWIHFTLCQRQFLTRSLRLRNRCYSESDRFILKEFKDKYLRGDGMFMLRTVSENSPAIEFEEFLAALWDHFSNHRSNIVRSSTMGENNDMPWKDSLQLANSRRNADGDGSVVL